MGPKTWLLRVRQRYRWRITYKPIAAIRDRHAAQGNVLLAERYQRTLDRLKVYYFDEGSKD